MNQLRCQECSLILRDLNRALPGAGNIKLSCPSLREQGFKTDSYGSKPQGKINKQIAKLTHQHDARKKRIKCGVCVYRVCVCVHRVWMCVHLNLCECACMHTVWIHIWVGTDRSKKRASDPLGLQLQEVVSCPTWVLKTELRSSERAVWAPDQSHFSSLHKRM